MSYKLTTNEAKLPKAVSVLKGRQDVPGQCLGYVREALGTIGLRLPAADLLVQETGHSTALACYHELAKDPGKYGWQRVTTPVVHPVVLAFYDDCGTNADGLVCGHVALLQNGKLYSSKDYPDGPYWLARVVGMFVPV